MTEMIDGVASIGWALITLSPCFYMESLCSSSSLQKHIISGIFLSVLKFLKPFSPSQCPNVGSFHRHIARSINSLHSSSIYQYFSLFLQIHSIVYSTFQIYIFSGKLQVNSSLSQYHLILFSCLLRSSPFTRTVIIFALSCRSYLYLSHIIPGGGRCSSFTP